MRIGDAVVVGGQPGPPDAVDGTRLHQYPFPRAEQELPQVGVLGELGPVALHHEIETALVPAVLVETPDLAAQPFRAVRVGGLDDAIRGPVVAEEPRLPRHHPVLSGGVAHPVDLEG